MNIRALLLLWDLGEGGSARRAHSRFIPAVLRAAAPSASATATAAASAALALAASFACADLASGFVPPEVEAVTAAALLLPPPLLPAIANFSVASSTKFCDFRRARSAEVCVCCAERRGNRVRTAVTCQKSRANRTRWCQGVARKRG